MAENVIELRDLGFSYHHGIKVLQNLSFDVRAGEKAVLIGPSGAGKTTLLHHLCALYPAQTGAVRVVGHNATELNVSTIRKQIGVVFQDCIECNDSTTSLSVAAELHNLESEPREYGWRVSAILEKMELVNLKVRGLRYLSHGQKRALEIAIALSKRPKLLLLDDPSAYLDPVRKEKLAAVLNKYSSTGTTVFIATHDVDFAAAWADRILVLNEGKLVADGPREILCNSSLMATANLRLPLVVQLFQGFLPRFFDNWRNLADTQEGG